MHRFFSPIEAANTYTVSNDKKLAISEIAGKDSITATSLAAQSEIFDSIIPTIAYTGTEKGDATAHAKNINILTKVIPDSIFVYEKIDLCSPELWTALNGRYISYIIKRYGQYSPCLGCHMYFHLCRVPLAARLGKIPIISGDKDTHDGRIKVSQLTQSINAYKEVLGYAGIEIISPNRQENNTNLKCTDYSYYDVKCYFDKNYYDSEKIIDFDLTKHEQYLQEFLIPISKSIVDNWTKTNYEQEIDYNSIAQNIVKNIF